MTVLRKRKMRGSWPQIDGLMMTAAEEPLGGIAKVFMLKEMLCMSRTGCEGHA